jgi:hypothetical protein
MSEQWKADALDFIHKKRSHLLKRQRQLDERKRANDALYEKQMRAIAAAVVGTPMLVVAGWLIVLWVQG